MHRRQFCSSLLWLVAAGGMAGCSRNPSTVNPGQSILSGCDDQQGRHYIAHLNHRGQVLAQAAVPQRVHDSLYLPQSHTALFIARRPGTHLYHLDLRSGRLLQTLVSANDRHYYGHGVLSADGQLLFLTENDLTSLQGIIGVYSVADNLTKVAEFSSGGVGPHQLALLPDQTTLVVANGGMATHPDSGRRTLNLGSMAPNLSYIRARDGVVLEQQTPPHHQMSIRHLDVSPDGNVVFGVQFQGAATAQWPLVGSHRQGHSIRWLPMPEVVHLGIHQYTASVAVEASGKRAAVSCPRGNLVACWDLPNGEFLGKLADNDVAGVHRWGSSGWLCTNGYGEVATLTADRSRLQRQPLQQTPWRWDNHVQVM
ncbi:MAG: hypothetical protein CML06_19510 [Pseudomonadales bacterium]|nr:hypothetical protein [Pseudomonadales bacterium]